MSFSDFMTALGVLITVVSTAVVIVVWATGRFTDTREQQIRDDKDMADDFSAQLRDAKAEGARAIEKVASELSLVKENAATRHEVNLTENRALSAISDLKQDNRKQFEKIDDKLTALNAVVGSVQTIESMMKQWLSERSSRV